jgi:hypothetical protein
MSHNLRLRLDLTSMATAPSYQPGLLYATSF